MLFALPIVVLVIFPEGAGWTEQFLITFSLKRLSIIGFMKGKPASFTGVLVCMFAAGNQDAVWLFP